MKVTILDILFIFHTERIVLASTADHVFELIFRAGVSAVKNFFKIKSSRYSLTQVISIVDKTSFMDSIIKVWINFKLVVDIFKRLTFSLFYCSQKVRIIASSEASKLATIV